MKINLTVNDLLDTHPFIDKTNDTVGGAFRLRGTRLPVAHILRALVYKGDIKSVANQYELATTQIHAALELAADILEDIE